MSSGASNGNPSGEGVGSPTARVPSRRFAVEAAGVPGEVKSDNLLFGVDKTLLFLAPEDAEKTGFLAPWKAGTTGMRAWAGGQSEKRGMRGDPRFLSLIFFLNFPSEGDLARFYGTRHAVSPGWGKYKKRASHHCFDHEHTLIRVRSEIDIFANVVFSWLFPM